MCRVLEVSKSGFYDWKKRRSETGAKEELIAVVSQLFEENRRVYGARRMRDELQKKGYFLSRKRVVKLMKLAGLEVRTAKVFKRTTQSDHGLSIAPNLLNRDFDVDAPNECWVSDITYIKTGQGWLYLAVFLDLYSRMIVGWSMGDGLETGLVLDAFEMGCERRKSAPGMVHSDRGVQYASKAFVDEISQHECQQSMSRKGNCWDNAVAESFFASLKRELMFGRNFATFEEAQLCIFEYIECFYNRIRLHSHLNYMSPEEFEIAQQVA